MKPDSELDREIQAILNVDPSPEFFARVRNRIEDAPAPAWHFAWTVFAVGAMAAAIVVAIVVTRPPQEALRAAMPQPLPETSAVVNVPAVSGLKPVLPAAASKVRASKVAERQEPEFFISSGETAAIQRLLRSGSIEQIEVVIETVEPQPLPETRLASITFFEPVLIEPSIPMALPKGDPQ
jgi:hypothetical protein